MILKSISKFIVFGLVILGLVLISNCKHDPVLPATYLTNDPIIVSPCDPNLVYYDVQIAPIFNSNCAISGCHDANTKEHGVDLSSYAQVIATGGIKPYKAEDSDIIEVLYDDEDDRMPPLPANHLPSELVSLLEKWINQGALNYSCDNVNESCDTVDMKYINDISPILSVNCVGCHSGSSPKGGIDLSTYSNVKIMADNGKLMGAINHTIGFVAMPQGGAKLNDCKIAKFNNWIQNGALNN